MLQQGAKVNSVGSSETVVSNFTMAHQREGYQD